MSNSLLAICGAAIVSVVFALPGAPTANPPQQERPAALSPPGPSNLDPFSPGSNRVQSLTTAPYLARSKRNQDPLAIAMKEFKEAEDDDSKAEAMDAIRKELENQYDAFLEANETQIEELQTRLDNLREQLDRRRDARKKMVELEIERVINESEGLIWPSRGRRNARSFGNLYHSNSNNQTHWRTPAEFPTATVRSTVSREQATKAKGTGSSQNRRGR